MIRGALWGCVLGLTFALAGGHWLGFLTGDPPLVGTKSPRAPLVVNDQFRWRVATPLLAGSHAVLGALVGLAWNRLSPPTNAAR